MVSLMLSRPVILSIFKTWWTRLYSLKPEDESWSGKGRCSALDLRGATRGSVLVLPCRDLLSAQVRRLDNPECKLWVKDFKVPDDIFNAPTSRLLALHHHHHKETVMHKILFVGLCYSCGQTGPYANRCPKKQAN
jgi:hypothetical protein